MILSPHCPASVRASGSRGGRSLPSQWSTGTPLLLVQAAAYASSRRSSILSTMNNLHLHHDVRSSPLAACTPKLSILLHFVQSAANQQQILFQVAGSCSSRPLLRARGLSARGRITGKNMPCECGYLMVCAAGGTGSRLPERRWPL